METNNANNFDNKQSFGTGDNAWSIMGKQKVSPTLTIIFGGIQFLFFALITYYLYQRMMKSTSKEATTEDILASKGKTGSETTPKKKFEIIEDDDDEDVWEERRKNGVLPSNSSMNKQVKGDKPFGSKYYYAHNNSNAKGGYSDGLRMEDYTMNKPRLLSRSKVTIEELTEEEAKEDMAPKMEEPKAVDENSSNDNNSNETKQSTSTTTTAPSPKIKPIDVAIPIVRYQWDDPGDKNGIANIRIDTLPETGSSSANQIAWQNMNIISTVAKIIGDEQQGLVVEVKAVSMQKNNEQEQRYQLNIPQLYGRVNEVKTVSKPKRLIVKLTKEKKLLDKSNLKAWPHPQKKLK